MRNLVLPVTASESAISSKDDNAATGTESFDILPMAVSAVVDDTGALVVVASSLLVEVFATRSLSTFVLAPFASLSLLPLLSTIISIPESQRKQPDVKILAVSFFQGALLS